MGALKRKLGIDKDTTLAPGTLVSARNQKLSAQLAKNLAQDNSVKGIAIKGLI